MLDFVTRNRIGQILTTLYHNKVEDSEKIYQLICQSDMLTDEHEHVFIVKLVDTLCGLNLEYESKRNLMYYTRYIANKTGIIVEADFEVLDYNVYDPIPFPTMMIPQLLDENMNEKHHIELFMSIAILKSNGSVESLTDVVYEIFTYMYDLDEDIEEIIKSYTELGWFDDGMCLDIKEKFMVSLGYSRGDEIC